MLCTLLNFRSIPWVKQENLSVKEDINIKELGNVVHAVEYETCEIHFIGETGQHFCEKKSIS